MAALFTLLAVLILIGTGYCIVKKWQVHMSLFVGGLALIVLAVLSGVTDILPRGVKSTGLIWFDIFDLIRTIAIKQSSGIGFIIMVSGAFAAYMSHIGAADALVKVSMKPLLYFRQPYLVLALAYIVAQALVIVIPSAAGLAMLLLVVMYPILVGLGISKAGAAAVIATSAGMTFAPTAGTSLLAAKVSNIEPIIYLVKCQLPVAIPTVLTVAVAHFVVQRYFDKKNDDVYDEATEAKKKEILDVPAWYALFPVVPLVLLIVFSPLVHKTITLSTVSALIMTWVGVVLIEWVRYRDHKKIFADAMVFFKSMGNMFATIVSLIICAEVFASGLKLTGLIDLLLAGSKTAGLGISAMTVVLTGIVGIVTFLTGSGVGTFSSFASLAPEVAAGLGGSPELLVTPMQFAAGMFRAMSPVAGMLIACAGCAGVSPIAIVRRTIIPMSVGMVVVLVANFFFLH